MRKTVETIYSVGSLIRFVSMGFEWNVACGERGRLGGENRLRGTDGWLKAGGPQLGVSTRTKRRRNFATFRMACRKVEIQVKLPRG